MAENQFESELDGASPTGAQSVDRAMQLLRLIGDAGSAGATLQSMAEALALSKPTCRRLLLALARGGMVEQTHHNNRYWLGAGLFALANQATTGHVMSADIRRQVQDLASVCGETCFLSVRRGNFGVIVDRFDPITVDVAKRATRGAEYPLGVGAAPLAIFSAISATDAEDSLNANDGLIARHFRRASVDKILMARQETLDQGYSLNRGMVFDGTWGLGVALRSRSGRVVGALSISAKAEKLLSTTRQRELGDRLIRSASSISTELPA
ncbi:MAG: hypothetical protein DI563_05935 [Variovorax paradoxus]|uniref:IclR family transcriptional regulator n=1 Tax=Variovorax paradoxus TaxID=34073 RepID=A0A2W5QKC5_VARPD|nr:MAG: hypothetical protein DI563_05935 [Variovorax paradoxus]